jgi:hypothetical protein
MISVLNQGEYYYKLSEVKKFIWFIYPKNVFETKVKLRPFFDREKDRIKSNLLEEFDKVFPSVVFYESYFEDVIDDLIDLGIDVEIYYDEKLKTFTPLFLKFNKGWIEDNSRNHCYCPQVLTKFIFDLHPELIPTE